MIKKIIMWFKHLTGSNEGTVIFWVDDLKVQAHEL